MIIKILLIASVLAAAAWVLRGRGQAGQLALTRLSGIVFAASWVVGVIFPEAVTWVAQLVGVGRGTDLVLYVLVVAFMVTALGQQQRLRRQDERLATLTRAITLLQHRVEAPVDATDRLDD
ncbi:DUF2304 domain-containing protein [Nocardioides sp. LS1]|uniref:DUF2304 domain-containing protein n=1 Tax=Nocardioides sp. LS1 TaxID=1027620 RepID=UPI000FFAEA53|nr:DUF2304 domain-containing protein [Nocardioides sp. LS1]GCD91781.1 hypothetical protein NLS1_37870 [Nocardioides sp. LS1]